MQTFKISKRTKFLWLELVPDLIKNKYFLHGWKSFNKLGLTLTKTFHCFQCISVLFKAHMYAQGVCKAIKTTQKKTLWVEFLSLGVSTRSTVLI